MSSSKISLLVPGKPYQPSLIFVDPARAYLKSDAPERFISGID
jgi:hypothetical protein